jgi:hypothetical protein
MVSICNWRAIQILVRCKTRWTPGLRCYIGHDWILKRLKRRIDCEESYAVIVFRNLYLKNQPYSILAQDTVDSLTT